MNSRAVEYTEKKWEHTDPVLLGFQDSDRLYTKLFGSE